MERGLAHALTPGAQRFRQQIRMQYPGGSETFLRTSMHTLRLCSAAQIAPPAEADPHRDVSPLSLRTSRFVRQRSPPARLAGSYGHACRTVLLALRRDKPTLRRPKPFLTDSRLTSHLSHLLPLI